MIEIELPWPDKRLNPNCHKGFRAKYPAQKEAKQIGYCEARAVHRIGDPVADRYMSQYTFHPPDDYRRRDIDNFVASMKHFQDGVAKALGIDDSKFEMDKPEWGDVVNDGKVVLTLEELE